MVQNEYATIAIESPCEYDLLGIAAGETIDLGFAVWAFNPKTVNPFICLVNLLASGNDAAYTTAVGVARQYKDAPYLSDDEAVSVFCGFMNDYAASIGMTGSSFVSPDGWDNDSQYSTVHDLIKLAAHVLTVPELREIVGTYCYSTNFVTGDAAEWTNSNKLLDSDGLYFCPTAIGMKTIRHRL